MISFLEGKKTYIIGVLGLMTVAAYLFGLINADIANTLLTIFGFGGLISLRGAIAKL